MASVRAGRPVPSCDGSDDAEGVDIQTREMIEWAMTGFLPAGPQSLDPPEGMSSSLTQTSPPSLLTGHSKLPVYNCRRHTMCCVL